MLRLILGVAIFALTLFVIMIRPYRIPEAVAACVGALLMLVSGFVSPGAALSALGAQWNVFGFFLGLMAISALADQAGIFDALAELAARWSGGSAMRLYLAVFAAGVVITAFLSNDATALILTPVVYTLVTRLRLPVLPFMFACTFIADTASFLLPVSNPINVLVLDSFGGDLATFLRYLLLPSLFCIALNIALFAWLFRRQLGLRFAVKPLSEQDTHSGYFRYTLAILALIALGYLVTSAVGAPLSLVALVGAAALLVGALIFHRFDATRLRREIAWPIFAFVGGMLILVQGIENLGVTAALGQGLLRLAGGNAYLTVLLVVSGTALGANVINNVPMALVMVSALHTVGASAAGQASLVHATILGADLGPNLTTVGSLATMLWLLILRRKGLEISTLEYLRLGLAVVPIMLVAGATLIWLRL
jgi:arsenical pump membrane protein